MGFGIQVKSNKDGSLLLGTDLGVDWYVFVEKLTYRNTTVWDTHSEGITRYHRYDSVATFQGAMDGTVPAFMLFIEMPTSGGILPWYFGVDMVTHKAGCAVFNHSTSYPSVYLFKKKTLAQSSDTDGLRLWNSNGDLEFDSGWNEKLLRVKEMPSLTLDAGQNSAAFSSAYSKIAALVSTPYRKYYGSSGNWTVKTLFAAHDTANNRISLTEKILNDAVSGSTQVIVPDGSTVKVPVIDCADYD